MELKKTITIIDRVDSRNVFKPVASKIGFTFFTIESHQPKSVVLELYEGNPAIRNGYVDTIYEVRYARIRFYYNDKLDHVEAKDTAMNGMVGVDEYNRISYIDYPFFLDEKTNSKWFEYVRVKLFKEGRREHHNHINLDKPNKKRYLYNASCNAISDVLISYNLYDMIYKSV